MIGEVLSGLAGIGVGVVLVLGYYWLRYGVIERRRQGRRNVALIDAAVARSDRMAARRSSPVCYPISDPHQSEAEYEEDVRRLIWGSP